MSFSAAPVISREFRFSNTDYSKIVTAFLVGYTIMQFLSGALVDLSGVKRSVRPRCLKSSIEAATNLHSAAVGKQNHKGAVRLPSR